MRVPVIWSLSRCSRVHVSSDSGQSSLGSGRGRSPTRLTRILNINVFYPIIYKKLLTLQITCYFQFQIWTVVVRYRVMLGIITVSWCVFFHRLYTSIMNVCIMSQTYCNRYGVTVYESFGLIEMLLLYSSNSAIQNFI